jgi:NAD(P)-dependent dehydrogenase (short-subunit alcohol dehydrogenase family)
VQRFGIRVAIVEPGVVVTPIFSKAQRFADPASPYFDHVRRLLLFYQKQMPSAAQPADAARVIYEAATTSQPRVRWLVGEDARLLVEGRRRMTDEEYVAGGREMSEEDYLASMQQRFGFRW